MAAALQGRPGQPLPGAQLVELRSAADLEAMLNSLKQRLHVLQKADGVNAASHVVLTAHISTWHRMTGAEYAKRSVYICCCLIEKP